MIDIDAVLFDWGHTLFETGSSIDFVVDRAATLGADVPRTTWERVWEDARQRSRTPAEIAKGRDLSPELHRRCWLELWAELDALCPGLAEELYTHETSAAGWQPYSDTRATLEALRDRGIPVVVVSDVAFDLRPIFEHHSMLDLVHDFVLSGEHGTIKPDGRLFHIALDLLGVAPGRALMVGDNPANDGAAVTVGIRTLLLPDHPHSLAPVLALLGPGS